MVLALGFKTVGKKRMHDQRILFLIRDCTRMGLILNGIFPGNFCFDYKS